MAIAGESMQSCVVRLVNGKVVDGQWAARHRSLLDTVNEAAEKLRRGEWAYLRATGMQLIELRAMFENDDEGEVKE